MYWWWWWWRLAKKRRGKEKERWFQDTTVMTLEPQQEPQQCPQIPHSDQQRQRGGRSRVDGADDFSDVRHNSTRFRLDPGYKARKIPERSIIWCVEKGRSTETHLARAI